MGIGSLCTRGVGSLALLALVTAFSTWSVPARAVDVFDVDHVVVAWDPASGPVTGYHVVAERNGQHEVVSSGPATQANIPGDVGDEVRVIVAAYDGVGIVGPPSPYSPTIRFMATPAPPPPPTNPPPPPPPPTNPPPPPPTNPPPPSGQHADLDFNGDGTADFLLRTPDGKLAIWNMDGSVIQSAKILSGLSADWTIVDNGDFDGNGKADIVWHQAETGRMQIWLLDGNQMIRSVVPAANNAPTSEYWGVGGSGDLDGDGDDELFLFSRVVGESWVFGLDANGNAVNQRMPGSGSSIGVDALGDYDGDGIDEVLWRDDRRHDLVLWDLDGAGASDPRFVSNSIKGWRLIGSGDFDGNGTDDLFVTRQNPDKVEVWLLDGPAVAGVVSLPLPGGSEWTTRSVGDHDRDGLADLSWTNLNTGELEIWFSNADSITAVAVAPTFGSATAGSASVVSGIQGSDDSVYRRRLCNGDFNGDDTVDWMDSNLVRGCYGSAATGACESVDMTSDGVVDEDDLDYFTAALARGDGCIQ